MNRVPFLIALRIFFLLEKTEDFSGVQSDLYQTTEKTMNVCDDYGALICRYDADGIGAGVRGDAKKINEIRKLNKLDEIEFQEFKGSGGVIDESASPFSDRIESSGNAKNNERTNADYFANRKAQEWWRLRLRFLLTYRAVIEKMDVELDDIISLSSGNKQLNNLKMELRQITYTRQSNGKLLINKMPEGTKSPNQADAVMMAFAKTSKKFRFF